MYYLYHIPGKKIGVTCNLNRRVTLTQGYNPDEYEVLDQSDDCLLYTSPSPRDGLLSRMPSSA